MNQPASLSPEVHPCRLLNRCRPEVPVLAALAGVLLVLGGLIVGYEPVGGDPDRLYRPLKLELAHALEQNRLPWWSDRFGLGVPLIAESHVAAFYPPNLLLYALLSVPAAYRISMLGHHLALAAATYALGRVLGQKPWGAALAASAFTFCGFMAIHSSHEPFYCLMPYLPLALCCTERLLRQPGPARAASLACVLGLQWTLGHFQIQSWTNGMVLVLAAWRSNLSLRGGRGFSLTCAAVLLGAALAAVQLVPSALFARQVGQTQRPVQELLFYFFPPHHWFEPAVPWAVRNLADGFEGAYWMKTGSTAYEAALYIGTIPLIFTCVGLFARNRQTLVYSALGTAALLLATMPHWSPWLYTQLLALPGLGYFRAPARYTLISSLALALLAGDGFDRAISRQRFRLGLCLAIGFALAAARAMVLWSSQVRPAVPPLLPGFPDAFVLAAVSWTIALIAIGLWQRKKTPAWTILLLTTLELAALYHRGTTVWGWSASLPQASPVLQSLKKLEARRVAGALENLPLWADAGTAYPYLGFTLAEPNNLLVRLQAAVAGEDPRASLGQNESVLKRWLRRAGVTHLVGRSTLVDPLGQHVWSGPDATLDRLTRRRAGDRPGLAWSIVSLENPFPQARVARRFRSEPDQTRLFERLALHEDRDTAWAIAGTLPDRPDATQAQLVSWDGASAVVDHEGACDLIIARTFDPGWQARIDRGPWTQTHPVELGLLAVRLEGSGRHQVELAYRPPGRIPALATAAASFLLILAGWTRPLLHRLRRRLKPASAPAHP